MKKCPQCKTLNERERKWCKECVAVFGSEVETAEPFKEGFDKIKKLFEPKPTPCPNCKKEVKAMAIKCEHCEYQLRVFDSPQSVITPIECPFCHTVGRIYTRNEVTNGGIIFAIVLLLFLCLPLFWIGLMIRETRSYCGACRMRIN